MLRNQRNDGEDCRGDGRFGVDRTSLKPHRLQLGLVRDHFHALVHVAQTARCEAHSRFVPRLEEPDRRDKEEDEQWQTP